MNIPDIGSANNSIKTEPESASTVSHPETHDVQQQQVERQDEFIRQEKAVSVKAKQVPSDNKTQNLFEAKEQPDEFIQSENTAASAVYNIKDINRSSKNSSHSETADRNKVLDIILPMGRKRLRIFIEE